VGCLGKAAAEPPHSKSSGWNTSLPRLEVVGGAPIYGREGDVPEIWAGGFEFDGGVETFGHGLSDANDFAGDAFFSAGVFENQASIGGHVLLNDDHRAVVIDADGGGVEGRGLALDGDVNAGADAQEDALAAAAFVGGSVGAGRCGGRLQRRKRFERDGFGGAGRGRGGFQRRRRNG
jgi:hypothetical protein